jgi:hypothetical protein
MYIWSIWAAKGGKGACNSGVCLGAIEIQIQAENFPYLESASIGNAHCHRHTCTRIATPTFIVGYQLRFLANLLCARPADVACTWYYRAIRVSAFLWSVSTALVRSLAERNRSMHELELCRAHAHCCISINLCRDDNTTVMKYLCAWLKFKKIVKMLHVRHNFRGPSDFYQDTFLIKNVLYLPRPTN